MVRRREPPASMAKQKVSEDEIKRFADAADLRPEPDGPKISDPHTFKALTLALNEYYYNLLDEAAASSGRTKTNFIRWSILENAKSVIKKNSG